MSKIPNPTKKIQLKAADTMLRLGEVVVTLIVCIIVVLTIPTLLITYVKKNKKIQIEGK
jgi:competence protein ComGC